MEFALVTVVLLGLLLGVLQVAVYLYVRTIAAASAAEGARFAANADVDPDAGAARAHDLLRRGAGREVAEHLVCTGSEEVAGNGLRLARIDCVGALPAFFAPLGEVLPVHVTARAVEEGDPS
ncbi:TadE/TadG family type IV pilus assembly protein [Cryptosporangium phraense]|uniref:Pilus assembly protein n=1 Tax=Cryptosporangium phraense TaxID=2593070 RepID=A0A545ANG1_9ACTN|nr:TadE/TadG family type IV pilus assembly protein [Cryptosporangium phraense]TQS42878.1 pilus assembly protein [Cryptosporangium phraense]